MLDSKALRQEKLKDCFGNIYLRRKDYSQIWIHQFLRVKVLRHLFENFPDEITSAKEMDNLLLKIILPDFHQLFVSSENFAVFGESTSRRMLTSNCYHSIQANGLELPSIPIDFDKSIIMGEIKRQF